jgi:hypothetical protein
VLFLEKRNLAIESFILSLHLVDHLMKLLYTVLLNNGARACISVGRVATCLSVPVSGLNLGVEDTSKLLH